MRNIKLTIEYDGSRYKGWQQAGKASNTGTISEKITDVLQLMTEETIELFCSARTEAGVHAIAQTASFKTTSPLSVQEMKEYLNHYLPQDIVILSVEEMPERFHAGLNAKTQTYLYRIQTGTTCDVFRRRYTFFQSEELDLDAMQNAIPALLGKHDFASFSSGKKKKGTEKEIFSIEIKKCDDEIEILITGNNFLHLMPRTIIATLLEIGYHQRPINCIEAIFSKKENASEPVPPHGLYLKEITF